MHLNCNIIKFNQVIMNKNYFFTVIFIVFVSLFNYAQTEKFYLDFESENTLENLPTGVTNVNGVNTVRVKDKTDYTATPNVVQSDPDVSGENELFLDFQGYLKVDVSSPSEGFSLAYDYRRSDENDDWWLGFLTFIGNDGTDNRLEQLQIREWSGQLDFAGQNTSDVHPIGFNTNYRVVVTVNNSGDLKVFVKRAFSPKESPSLKVAIIFSSFETSCTFPEST